MKYHFIGIGGVSMSGLARLMFDMGNEITGCDLQKVDLDNDKIIAFVDHSENHISKDLDGIIVTSAALHDNSPAKLEIEKARELNIPIIKRSEMIGKLMSKENTIGIAISGMHGKTTVSTMLSLILEKAGYDPTCLIGSDVKEWKKNYRYGKSKYFITEACEYEKQLLDFRPKMAIITNIEEEHLDTYTHGIKEIKSTFKKFIKLIPNEGLLILNKDNKESMSLYKSAKCKIKTFSKEKLWSGLKLKVPGLHNLLNATAAAKLAHELGIDNETIKEVLNNYTGAKRRFEIKGNISDITVVDDYAHHPTEIKSTLQALKGYINTNNLKSRIIVVFQPHQYSRTKLLFKDFATSFVGTDKLIVSDIYLINGREPSEARADFSKELVEEIKKNNIDAEYISNYDNITKKLSDIAKKGDIIITIGATNIYKVGEEFLSKYNKENQNV